MLAVFDIEVIDQCPSREESFKTLRELPVFGDIKAVIDFRYPTNENLMSMPKDKPI